MGKLSYGPQERAIECDDRTLTHLKIVIMGKLRRNEPFLLSWQVPQERGGGRESVWMHPSIPLHFRFDGGHPRTLNRAWIDQMIVSANAGELRLRDEPTAEA